MGRLIGALFVSSLVLSLILPVLACPAAADGFSVRYSTALDAWSTISEEEQFCIINYHDGVEKMIVQIQLNRDEVLYSSKIAWLFPVPSAPEDVSLRHLQTVPRLDGDPLGSVVLDEVVDDPSWYYAYATQLYTIPFVGLMYLANTGFGSSSGAVDEGVQSFAVLDQYGVTTEVLAVDSAEALGEHLRAKDITLPESTGPAVEEYLGGDYSFVLSWVSNVTDFLSEAVVLPGTFGYSIGVGVEFPCEEMFFPLRMTSAYGSMRIPITVQVLDFVTPDRFPSSDTLDCTCGYRVQDTYSPLYPYLAPQYPYWMISKLNLTTAQEDFRYFFAEQISEQDTERLRSVDYTVMRIEGPAEDLSEDLWFDDSPPLSISAVGYLCDNPWPLVVAVLAAISCTSSLIACSIVFGWDRRLSRTYVLLGVFNLLTLIGYCIAYRRLLEPRLRAKNAVTDRKLLRLALVFSVLFISLTTAVLLWLMSAAA